MEDPTIVTQFGDSADPLADYLKNTWGIILGNGYSSLTRPRIPLYLPLQANMGPILITQKLQGMVTVFPYARSVSTTTVQGVTPTTLITTGQASWAETNLAGLQNNQIPTPEPGRVIIGSVPIAVAAENTGQGSRIVVIGNSTLQSTVIMLPMETVIF